MKTAKAVFLYRLAMVMKNNRGDSCEKTGIRMVGFSSRVKFDTATKSE